MKSILIAVVLLVLPLWAFAYDPYEHLEAFIYTLGLMGFLAVWAIVAVIIALFKGFRKKWLAWLFPGVAIFPFLVSLVVLVTVSGEDSGSQSFYTWLYLTLFISALLAIVPPIIQYRQLSGADRGA